MNENNSTIWAVMACLLIMALTHSFAAPSPDGDSNAGMQPARTIYLLVFEVDLLECPGCREPLIARLADFCGNSLSHEKMAVIVPKPGVFISEEHVRIYSHQFTGILKRTGVDIPFVVLRKSNLSMGMVNNFLVLQASLPGIQTNTVSHAHSNWSVSNLRRRIIHLTSGLNTFAIIVSLTVLLLLIRRALIMKTCRQKLGEKRFAWKVWYHPAFRQARVNLILLGLGLLMVTLTYVVTRDSRVLASSFPVLVLVLVIQSKAGVVVREGGVVINLDAVAWEEISGWAIDRSRNLLKIVTSVTGCETMRQEIPPRFHDAMAALLQKQVRLENRE